MGWLWNTFIASELNLPRATWIGAFQPAGSAEPTGGWQWVTGEPWTYTYWVPGREPNNGDGGPAEDYANIYGSENSEPLGSWNDYQDLPLTGYVAEYEMVGQSPDITSQPHSLTTNVGPTVSFAVSATGADPLGYQWRFNGTALNDGARFSGAASSNLTIEEVQIADAGCYSVVVTNSFGAVTSVVATLAVTVPALASELVGYWRLDGDARDGSAYGNHGVVHGDLTYVEHDPWGRAGEFVPTNSCYVEIANQAQYDFTNSFAIAFWFRPVAESSGGRYMIQKVYPTVDYGSTWHILLQDSRDVYFAHARNASATDYFGPVALVTGAWNHVAFSFDGQSNVISSYLNGVLSTNQVPANPMVPLVNSLSLLLMHDRHMAHYDATGWLDEVALWSRDLSAFEVRRLSQGVSPTEEAQGRFISVPPPVGGAWQVVFAGEVGATYTIQSSTDLINWVDLATLISFDGTVPFTTSVPPSLGGGFYRALRR